MRERNVLQEKSGLSMCRSSIAYLLLLLAFAISNAACEDVVADYSFYKNAPVSSSLINWKEVPPDTNASQCLPCRPFYLSG